VSALLLMGSPRCDITLIRKVALPARTRCVSRQTISRRMSASIVKRAIQALVERTAKWRQINHPLKLAFIILPVAIDFEPSKLIISHVSIVFEPSNLTVITRSSRTHARTHAQTQTHTRISIHIITHTVKALSPLVPKRPCMHGCRGTRK
jgi:hypothetical protein